MATTPQELSLKDSDGGIHYRKTIDGAIARLTKVGQITHPQRGLLQVVTKVEPAPKLANEEEAGEKAQRSYHDRIRDMLYEIGQIEKKGSEKEYHIDGERIDVAWKKIPKGDPYAVFEVQVSGNPYEALAKLKHAWDKWSSRLFLITTAEQTPKASEWLSGAFHEIQETKIMGCEKVEELYKTVKIAWDIKTELGIK